MTTISTLRKAHSAIRMIQNQKCEAAYVNSLVQEILAEIGRLETADIPHAVNHTGEWISEAISPEEERLRLMADGDNQWDLSENDRNAISWVLGALRHRTERMNSFQRSLDAVVRCAMDAESENCRICDSENDYEHRHTEDCPILEAERVLSNAK